MRFKGLGAWEDAGTIRNGYSIANAKYDVNPQEKQLFRDQVTFLHFGISSFWALGVESPNGGAIFSLSRGRHTHTHE